MTKSEIIKMFVAKGILSNKTKLLRRPNNWKSRFDKEAKAVWNIFIQQYRSEAEAWFCLCRNIELPICPICGKKKVKFTGVTKNGARGYNLTCEDCSANKIQAKKDKAHSTCAKRTDAERKEIACKRRATNKKLYGDENYTLFGSDSFHQNLDNKYGDPFYNNSEQTKQTNLARYGVVTNLLIPKTHEKAIENSWSDAAKQKRKNTCIENFGVECFSMAKENIDKAQCTKQENIRKFEQENNCTLQARIVEEFGQGYKALDLEYIKFGKYVFIKNDDIPLIKKYHDEGHHTNSYVSAKEKDLLQYIRAVYQGKIIENDTSVVPNENHRCFEVDIYLPEINLAIDFNGVYWHSTVFKDKYYHQRKTRCARKVGVKYLHIFEDQWDNNKSDVCNQIEQCIAGTFKNLISTDGNIITGNNAYPIFGNYKILEITEPRLHTVENLAYYDCGTILYVTKE